MSSEVIMEEPQAASQSPMVISSNEKPTDDTKDNTAEKEVETLTEMSTVTDNKDTESNNMDSRDSSVDQDSSVRNKELKSLLQLSKEAKLDTNITHKRVSTPDRKEAKRSMRSQNPEFAAKQQSFLSKVTHGYTSSSSDRDEKDDSGSKKKKRESSSEMLIGGAMDRRSKLLLKSAMELVQKNKDGFCWKCHRDGVSISCTTCPRSYHTKCLRSANANEHWICPECSSILTAESIKTRSTYLKNMPLGHLSKLLKFALKRMVQISNTEPFVSPVDESEFPDYVKYIVQPMDFAKLEKNIKANVYGSTKAFEADAKWLLHNSIVFNSYQSKVTTVAKAIIKVCKQEMAEIENCPTCYLNANTKKSWFVEVCPKPHLLVWAKLKGFPYWPAKVMCTNNQGLVDVRFFGAHDRAWVSAKECFLYSIKDPNLNHHKRDEINECIKEVDIYIQNLKSIYGKFNFPPYRTPFEIDQYHEQLQMFLPDYKKDSDSITPTKLIQNKEDISDEEDDWELSKYIEKEQTSKSPSPEPTPKRTNMRKTPVNRKHSKTPSLENLLPPKKMFRRSSMHSSLCESSWTSNTPNKITKGEIGSENSKDSPLSNDKEKVEKKPDLTTSPATSKLKMADKLMKKLTGSNEEENKGVVITSCGNSPEKNIVESENDDDCIMPSLNDIKQVILGGNLLENEKPKVIYDTIAKPPIKQNDLTSKKSEPKIVRAKTVQIPLPDNYKPKPKENNTEKTEIKHSDEIKLKSKKVKTKTEHNGEKLKLKPEIKSELKSDIKPDKSEPVKFEPKKDNTKSNEDKNTKKLISPQDCAVDDDESLLEEMYFELIEEQNDKQTEVTEKVINSTPKRKRSLSIPDLESPIQTKLVKLVDIDLIKNPKLHPLDIPDGTPLTPMIKESIVMSPSSEEFVEIKDEIESDDNLSDDYTQKSYATSNKTSKNTMKENIATIKKPFDFPQKSVHPALLKTQEVPKSILVSTGSLGTTTAPANVTTKIMTTGIDSGSVMILAQQKGFVGNPIVLPPNQSITYGGNSIFVQHPQFSNYLIPTTALNVGTISLPASSISNQIENQDPISIVSQSQISTTVTKPSQATLGSIPKAQIQNISVIAKPTTTSGMPIVPKPIQLNASNIKQGVGILKPNISKQQSSSGTSLSTTRPNQTPHRGINKLNVNLNPLSPKAGTKQLPPLRRASQIPLTSQVSLTTIASSAPSNVTTSGISTAINISIPPPLCSLTVSPGTTTVTNQIVSIPATGVSVNSTTSGQSTTTTTTTTTTSSTSDVVPKADPACDYSFLSGHVPDRLVKAISEIISRPSLPALTPKPQGPLTTNLDQGSLSAAGPVALKVNSIAHKLTDYFRGMLVDFLSEFSSPENYEAEVASLKLEVENMKLMHSFEISEMKKNLQTILKDMQKNFSEERQKIIEETRKTCELEAIKRVDEAKSKQWCSNCMKEAQFYCCWNTSYCDYPCQIEHWPTHMEKCTQNIKTDGTNSPKPNMGKKSVLSKMKGSGLPHNKTPKVYSSPKTKIQKPSLSSAKGTNSPSVTNTITIVEQTPGSYKLAGNGPISVGGKLFQNVDTKVGPTLSGSSSITLNSSQQKVDPVSSTVSGSE